MDSDLPLIQIAGADDSLLYPTTSTDDAYFFCSPLHPPRSRSRPRPNESMKVSGDSLNKENSNVNKIEEKKFSLHPQQMKRKKKKGGYNLRKSLAWDRAFFEEEGVLNSEELSMITTGSLSVIHEESGSDSAYLQNLEEKIFKVNPGSTPKKDRITGGSPLSKHSSPARDNAVPGSAGRQKVLTARDSNRSGSKRSGCPRPMASSSIKRPANVNTLKSATKEPQISKLPVPKPVPCGLSKTSKNVTVGASDLKRSQIAHPEVNSNNTRTGRSRSTAKVGPTGKSLTGKSGTLPTRRNAASSVKSSPTNAQCLPVTEAKDRLEVIPKQALPSTSHTSYDREELSPKNAVPEEITSRKTGASASHASYSHDDRLRKASVSLSHIGVNLPHTQLQTSKPSGLRMPSPSLSFFNQQKASSLSGTHKSSSQPCQIPNLRHIGSVNPVPDLRLSSSGKIPKVGNAGTVKGNANVQCESSSSVPAISSAALAKVDSVSQIRHVQAELKVPIKSKGYGMMDHRKLNSTPVHVYQQSTPQAESNISENLSYMEDVESHSGDKYLADQGSSLACPPKQTEIEGHSFEKVADPEVRNGTAGECKTVEGFSYSRCEDQAKNDNSTLKTMSRNLHVEGAQILASDGKTDEINNVKLSSSAPDNWPLVKVDNRREKPEDQDISNPCYIEEQVYQDDCVLDSFNVVPEKSQQNSVLLRVELKESQGNDSGNSESTTSRNIYVTLPVMLDCRSTEVEMVDSPNVENTPLVCEDNRAVVENHNLVTQFMDGNCVHSQSSLELPNMDEDQRRVSPTAHDIKVTSLKCGDSMSQLNLTMPIEAGSDLSVESSCHASQLLPADDIISCHQDTFLVIEEEADMSSGELDDGEHIFQQAEQVISCSSSEVRILNWNPGDYGLQSEGSKIVEVCHKYNTENSEDISLKVNWCDVSGLQSPPDLSKHKICEEANNEVDEGNDVIKQPLPGSSEDQSSVPNCRYSELRHPNVVAVRGSQEIKPRSGNLLANNGSCEEHEETYENRDDASTKCSNACKEVAPAIPDGRPDLGGKIDYSQLELAVTRSSMFEQSVENANSYAKSRGTNRLCDQAASVESYSSGKIIEEEESVRTLACTSLEGKSRSSLISDQTSPSGSIMQESEVNVMSSHTVAEDAETNILESNRTLNDELQQESDDTMHPPEERDSRKELKKSRSGRKQDGLVIIPPSDAAPFSDEWLAAVEAAGEEILTKKGGAVQNSPPNKSPPRLGPYSPVKRKQNQVLGPFDCTKHTNLPGSQ